MLWICHSCHCGGCGAAKDARPHEADGRVWNLRRYLKRRFFKTRFHFIVGKIFVGGIKDTEEHHLKHYFEQCRKPGD
jgi:hypothetical protein